MIRISSFRAVLLAAALAAPAATAVYAATPVETAQSQLAANDLNGALKTLDKYLTSAPQDAEARFTRGLILVRLNKVEDALKAFSALTRDYPQLPEPYNNLAVLYAQQGDYEKARDALEAALATHPAYATAHENLGDIYAALAGAAYNRALMLDKENSGLKSKLSVVNQLDTGLTSKPASASIPQAVAAAPVSKAPLAVARPVEAPRAMAPAMPAPVAPMSSDVGPAPSAVTDAVQAWARAWSAKDVSGYLAAYAAEFQPEGGLARATWEAQRRDRINRPSRISVKLIDVKAMSLGDDKYRVSFTQDYRSDNFNDQVGKVLELKAADGTYKITREGLR